MSFNFDSTKVVPASDKATTPRPVQLCQVERVEGGFLVFVPAKGGQLTASPSGKNVTIATTGYKPTTLVETDGGTGKRLRVYASCSLMIPLDDAKASVGIDD